jgi:hypothetical protein
MVHFQRLLREPPSSILGGSSTTTSTAAARRPTSPRSPGGWRRTTWSRCRWWTTRTGWSGAVTVDDVLDHSLPAGLARPATPDETSDLARGG